MNTIALEASPRRRRLAWLGGLFLAFDAITMGGAIAWMTEGRHLALAAALAGAGVAVSALLALVLARAPRASLRAGVLKVEAGFQTLSLATEGMQVSSVDLRAWPKADWPTSMQSPRWWQAGDAQGWQRNRTGQRWFAALPAPCEAFELVATDGERLRLAPKEPKAFLRALVAAGATHAG